MITTYFPRLILRALDLQPEQQIPFWEGCDLRPSDVYSKSEIALPDFLRLLSFALEWSENPALGLEFGQHAQSYLIGEYSSVGLNAPDLQSCLLGLINFSALQASYIRFEAQTTLYGMTVKACISSDLGDTGRTQQEVTALTLQNYIELITNAPFTQGHVQFAFTEPDYSDRYSSVFHTSIEFGADNTAIFIPQDLLNISSVFYDEELWHRGKLLCNQRMQELNSKQNQYYSDYVMTLLKSQSPPLPTVSEVASDLNISERTLHRRLNEEGRNYREIYNTAMMDWAKIYLIESNTCIEKIAGDLGYMEAANFRRAFKRLTGLTPTEFRESH